LRSDNKALSRSDRFIWADDSCGACGDSEASGGMRDQRFGLDASGRCAQEAGGERFRPDQSRSHRSVSPPGGSRTRRRAMLTVQFPPFVAMPAWPRMHDAGQRGNGDRAGRVGTEHSC